MHIRFGWWIVVAIMLLLDCYVFNVIRGLQQTGSDRTKLIVFSLYWLVAILSVMTVLTIPYLQSLHLSKFFRNYLFAIIVGIFFAKLLASLFFAVDDIRRIGVWLLAKFIPDSGVHFADMDRVGISRSTFLSWMGIAVGGGLFSTLVYGFSNKYNYQIKKIKLNFPNLPIAFQGLRILQISDIHSGSFTNKEAVNHGVDMILAQKADIILFTGDLVNDRADEMKDYMDVFARLKAPMGVYSTLGNHDYGDYTSWPSAEAKAANMEDLKQIHATMGWRLLMNEHIVFERNGEKIALLGIENWGAKGNFPKHGKMTLAYPGTEKIPFKILMSHDPSHWDAEVRVKYPDIDLTLAGHTHGMQFGVELPYFRWSPVEWMYKQWAGVYSENKQYLYVNRGFGFIGYPGRVGILPEITVIEMQTGDLL